MQACGRAGVRACGRAGVLYAYKGAGVLSLFISISVPCSISLIGEEGECGRALCLQGCSHHLHRSERERERERKRERVRKREREM